MIHAHEVNVGDGFIASVWLADWKAQKDAVINGKPMDGVLLSVSIVVPGGGTSFLQKMLRAHCALPANDDAQIDWRQAMWVAGIRDKRSKKVTIKDWAMPAYVVSGSDNAGGAR